MRTHDLSSLTLASWVTSDQHWQHPRIREYQNRPADHFELMRRLWIERVKPDDVLLHLGDIVCFGDRAEHPRWMTGLPGRKLLLRGNHDDHSDQWYEAAGFEVIGRKPILWVVPGRIHQQVVCFSHEPDTELFGWDINVHGHTHANPYWEHTPMLDYRNVCVEQTDYAPVRLRDVLYGTEGGRRLLVDSSV